MDELGGRQRFLTKTGELRQTQLNRCFHSMLWPVGQHGMRIWFMPLALLLSAIFQRRIDRPNRVGGEDVSIPAVLPHHRTYGSVSGGS